MEYKECFSIFNSSYTDKEIPKDVLLNNIDNNEDKEIIERFVENLFLKYCIKAENINKESEKNFSEIEIIEININNLIKSEKYLYLSIFIMILLLCYI